MRLELSCTRELSPPPEFQFHKGAIRTCSALFCNKEVDIFQFHKGAIRTSTAEPAEGAAMVFQFHKGAIRTELAADSGDVYAISIP